MQKKEYILRVLYFTWQKNQLISALDSITLYIINPYCLRLDEKAQCLNEQVNV